ncbi:MAG: hypothetical protein WCC84_13460 [Candidatus Cybelea sp.]
MKRAQRSGRAIATSAFACLLAVLAVAPARAVADGCISRAAAAASPAPSPSEAPLYPMGDDIYTIDHDATLFYYFQGNRDGTAKVKKEARYDRNLWNTCAQLQIRIPFITKYPTAAVLPYSPDANPYSGLGNLELRYLYAVPAKTFDHTIAVGVALPTQANGVESIDTQLKFFYITKWKWSGGALASTNEYDQTVIRPPGAGYTSYYEQEITVPYWSFIDSPDMKGLKISASYTGRVLFNDGSIYKSAIGWIMNGSINDVGLSLRDTWGIGANGVWKYKVEANATARLNY